MDKPALLLLPGALALAIFAFLLARVVGYCRRNCHFARQRTDHGRSEGRLRKLKG
ncbi:hypothetical protein [Pannonibacter phragmitetus]|uniref:hypothetical protein n=1 Tax=Pannonibacter phragmitetus TaxID=121719 RepID=UPI003CC7DC44